MTTGKRKLIPKWEDIVLIYAGQQMQDEMPMRDYHVPPVSGPINDRIMIYYT
jgi:hypothetical protein